MIEFLIVSYSAIQQLMLNPNPYSPVRHCVTLRQLQGVLGDKYKLEGNSYVFQADRIYRFTIVNGCVSSWSSSSGV